jgi:hypothetical protein
MKKQKKDRLEIEINENQDFLKPNLSKKSQLKIQEMAFMLVAVVFFFILVGLFALSIFYVNLYDDANKLKQDRTLSAMTNLADTPELSCATSKSNCIDADKLISLVGNEAYERFWPYSSLEVVRSRAFKKSSDEMIECNLANYQACDPGSATQNIDCNPSCDKFIVYDKEVRNERKISSYVALCRKEVHTELYDTYTYEKCEIAKIVAGTEVRVQGDR